jgi:hypothetical protein
VCELLVMIHGKPKCGDVAMDCHREERGDVIVAVPDGHDWTHEERAHPRWVVVKCPEMSLAEGEAMMSMEPLDLTRHGTTIGFHTNPYLRKRFFYLDHPVLPRGDHTVESLTLSLAEVRSAKRQKPPAVVPHDVIG